MLGDFFRINMPYGIARNSKGEWMAFNREYMPLGYNDEKHKRAGFPDDSYLELPIYTKYSGITEKKLLKLAARDGDAIRRNEKGEIYMIWFYNDATNPVNCIKEEPHLWSMYFDKIKILSKLNVSIPKNRL